MSSPYDIAGVLPDGTLEELSPGTSLLIRGPAMVGKRQLAIRILAAGHSEGEGILCVTTNDNAGVVLDELEREIPTVDRNRVGVVDCSGHDGRETPQIATEHVPSPGDLTGISIGTAKLLQRFAKQDVSGVRHGLLSVSTLLQYLELNTVFKFLHIYTSRIADTGGLGVFTIDDASHDPQTINTITSEFDCVVELRGTDDGRELRLLDHSGSSQTWRPY